MINLQTATKLVKEGVDDIFRKAINIGEAESGDITPQEDDQLEEIILRLAELMKIIINTNQ
tara:strand:+ start:57 stop:239 length:183 start_codon:yes stop_codon:yes gene_type:complete